MIYNPETPINEIKPYDKNPRIISADATSAVAASIEEFGFLNPIVIDQDGVILAGHNRYKAAKQIGLKTVPTLQTTISELKARGYRIASNRTGEISQWDRDLLDKELADIMTECNDLIDSMGISEWEIKRVQAQAEQAVKEISTKTKETNPAPSIPSKPIEGLPQIVRSVLILDKPAQMPQLLELVGVESAADVPTSLHAAEIFKKWRTT